MIRLWLIGEALILTVALAAGLPAALVVVAGGVADGLRLVGAGIGAALLAAVALWYANSHGATDAVWQTAFCLWFVSFVVGGGAVVVYS